MNYVLVPDNQPRVTIPFLDYPDESDLDGGTYPSGSYPIPTNQPIETWPRGTGNLTLQQWQQDVNNKWWRSPWNHGCAGSRFDLGNVADEIDPERMAGLERREVRSQFNALRPAGWTSGDAAGLSMFVATVRYDECQRGMVEHALRLVVKPGREGNTFIRPRIMPPRSQRPR